MSPPKLIVVRQGGKPYPRNSLILDMLRVRHDILEIVCEPGAHFKYSTVLLKLWKGRHHAEKILFLFPAQIFVPMMAVSRLLFGQKIYVDAFTSLYESAVHDRRTLKSCSPRALLLFMLDFLSGRLAHVLLFDTPSSEKYFRTTFGASAESHVIPVCVDIVKIDSVPPEPHDDDRKFRVFFYGTYIPLQGIEYILEAASMLADLKDVEFTLVGSGQTKRAMLDLAQGMGLRGVRFLDTVPYEKLIAMIKSSDICLGIFGTSAKAGKVIPNKVIDYLACGKSTITGRNDELETSFVDRRDILYCRRGDAADLAEKIREAFSAGSLDEIGRNGRKKIETFFNRGFLEARLDEALK